MRRVLKANRMIQVITIISFFSFLQACATNLPAVRDFSQTTVVATDSFAEIAQDIPGTCNRRVELAFINDKVMLVNGEVEYTEDYKSFKETCEELDSSLEPIIVANTVLREYAEALGELASNDTVTFNEELSTLRTNLSEVSISGNIPFQGQRADAVFNLAQFLVNIAAEGYRQSVLKSTIETGEQYMGPITEGLSSVSEIYQSELESEKSRVLAYQKRVKRELNRSATNSDLNEKLFQTKKRLDSIEEKNVAAVQYREVLEKIRETHSKLARSSSELDSVALIILVQDYSRELIPLIKQINSAFLN